MKCVLVVDDSNSMRQMVTFTLKEAGFKTVEAADGQVALDEAKKQKFDLIISDVNMPIMDGIAFVKEVRALPDYKFIPILMLTTESSQDKKVSGKIAGATGWLVKPFDPVRLIETVRKVLG